MFHICFHNTVPYVSSGLNHVLIHAHEVTSQKSTCKKYVKRKRFHKTSVQPQMFSFRVLFFPLPCSWFPVCLLLLLSECLCLSCFCFIFCSWFTSRVCKSGQLWLFFCNSFCTAELISLLQFFSFCLCSKYFPPDLCFVISTIILSSCHSHSSTQTKVV